MVSAPGLWRQYHNNEVAADEAYNNRALLVFAVVDSIEKDAFDHMVIGLQGGSPLARVHAFASDTQKSAVAALEKGNHVRMICRGSGMVLGTPVLADCSFPRLALPEDPTPSVADLAHEIPALETKLTAIPAYQKLWQEGHEKDRRLFLSAASQLAVSGEFAGDVLAAIDANKDLQNAAITLWLIAVRRDWPQDFVSRFRNYLGSIRAEPHLGVRSEVVRGRDGWDFSAIAYLVNEGSPAYFREFLQDRKLPGRLGWQGQKPTDGEAHPYFVEHALAHEYMRTLLKLAEERGESITTADCASVGLQLQNLSRGEGRDIAICM